MEGEGVNRVREPSPAQGHEGGTQPHTPGPWRFERVPDYQGQPHLIGGWITTDAELIAEVRGAVEIDGRELRNAANARLIAAAPEMRGLLGEAWGALNFILAFYEPGQRHLDTEAWKQAEAAGRRVHAALRAKLDALSKSGAR